jgi:restriction endonuclease S subunit
VNPELLLRSGDVLFPNRGTRTTAIAYRSDDDLTIVGAQFFIVRPNTMRLLPEYLAWYLRSEEVAHHFETRRKGTYIKIIQRSDLAELEIPVPGLETQHRIVEINKLSLQEGELLTRIQTRRQSLMEAMLRDTVRRQSASSQPASRSKKTKPIRKS